MNRMFYLNNKYTNCWWLFFLVLPKNINSQHSHSRLCTLLPVCTVSLYKRTNLIFSCGDSLTEAACPDSVGVFSTPATLIFVSLKIKYIHFPCELFNQ